MLRRHRRIRTYQLRDYFTGLFFSMPLQLLLLHLRRYQILLLPWGILFATVAGNFMQRFGASSLFLAPEYMGSVNWLSTGIVGFAFGLFVMSWNITTFILNGQYFRYLATTAQPFVKYCINNALLPLLFLFWYFGFAWAYGQREELIGTSQLLLLISGFLLGFVLSILLLTAYFYNADVLIYRSMATIIDKANLRYFLAQKEMPLPPLEEAPLVRVDWFLSARLGLRKPRDVRHYSRSIINTVFKRHHQATVVLMLLALAGLTVLGFLLDDERYQFPAASSILVLFALLVGLSGAISLFFRSWSIVVAVGLYAALNFAYQHYIIDGRNRAYGLHYEKGYADYSLARLQQMVSPQALTADSMAFIMRLNAWKARQKEAKPLAVIISVSGGGTRSSVFTARVLQKVDEALGGNLMQRSVLIAGASGGMMGAAWYRAVYHERGRQQPAALQDKAVVEAVSGDLLNPVFSSFVSRDMTGFVRKFPYGGQRYAKDRGYAFEEKLNRYTQGLLDRPLRYYRRPEDEGLLPTLITNPVIVADGRKLITATRPMRFLMVPGNLPAQRRYPDGVDFQTLFEKQDGPGLRLLTALRMNATFPYVLPNVWLPTTPVVDVMDAGLRDNYGGETTLRLMEYFSDWFAQNTRGVVVLELRDRHSGEWNDKSFDPASLFSFFSKPLASVQRNLFGMQDNYQTDALQFVQKGLSQKLPVYPLRFEYRGATPGRHASMSFHLTNAEKWDIASSVRNADNEAALQELVRLMK